MNWYFDVGNLIIQLLVIQIFFPPLEIACLWMMKFVLQAYDQKRCCRKKFPEATRKRTLKAYMDLYCGPEFDIHYQYANMLIITWVTFLFAPGLPILIPLALLGCCILYCTNRLGLAYFYRKPTIFDQKMNQTTLKMLGFAPILYVCMGAWVYSNQQTFRNKITVNKDGDLFMNSEHNIDVFWTQITPGSVFIGYLFLISILLFVRGIIFFGGIKSCFTFPMQIKNEQISQKLSNFFSALSTRDRNSLIREEVIDHKRLGTSKLSKKTLIDLALAKPLKKNER